MRLEGPERVTGDRRFLHHPRAKAPGGSVQCAEQRFQFDPFILHHFIVINMQFAGDACCEYRANLVLHDPRRIGFTITELRGDGGDIGDLRANLKAATADDSLFRLFTRLRMSTNGVGPDTWPGFFA